jgi:hypothetical protein
MKLFARIEIISVTASVYRKCAVNNRVELMAKIAGYRG